MKILNFQLKSAGWSLAFTFLFLLIDVTGQQPHQEFSEHPKNKVSYDISKPTKKWSLPPELLDISGLAWLDKKHFLVIEDLSPNLFLLQTGDPVVIKKIIPFKKTKKEKFDIEDLVMVGDTAFALWSHGKIFRIVNWRHNPQVTELSTTLSKENNTEGICYDPVSGHLLIACKEAAYPGYDKKNTRAVYEFDQHAGQLLPEPFLLIQKKDFKELADEKLDFYPSAIAVHPETKDIYILSTRENKCMAVYDRSGRLKSFQWIDKSLMPQPEGICFSPEGVLYISTQGRNNKPPAIYEFPKQK